MKRPELMLLEVAIRAGSMLLGAAKGYLKAKQTEFERELEQPKETTQKEDPISLQ